MKAKFSLLFFFRGLGFFCFLCGDSKNSPKNFQRTFEKLLKKPFPNFISKSVEKVLINIGFENIVKLDFQKYYQFEDTNLLFTLLKSGDFRDDSGLYFTYGGFSFFSTVDANNINFNKFPENTTLFLSNFAGAASGYPLCHDHLNEQEKFRFSKFNKENEILSYSTKPGDLILLI